MTANPRNSANIFINILIGFLHSFLISGLKIEWEEYQDILTFHPEYTLNTGPRRIDCLITKAPGSPAIPSPIARIFRQYNIVDYKSPDESMTTADFYKVLSYAYSLPAFLQYENILDEMTVTLIAHRSPHKLVSHLLKKYGKVIEKKLPGLYHIHIPIGHAAAYSPSGQACISSHSQSPQIQLVVLPKLPACEYIWLHSITNKLTPEVPIRELSHICKNHSDDPDYQNFIDSFIRANNFLKEADSMYCDALYELFADELAIRDAQGFARGMDRLSALIQKLISDDRSSEIAAVTSDPEYRDKLLKQYQL